MFTRRWSVALAATLALALGAGTTAAATAPAEAAPPLLVTVPGDHGAALGCPGDWQPECSTLALDQRPDGMYSAELTVPAGTYHYKVAVGGSWDENYGVGGAAGGDNIEYTTAGGPVTFFYDPITHFATNSAIGPVIAVAGSFQQQLGCSVDWAADCLAGWLQDADGDGVATFQARALATGGYEVKVVHGLSWSENYGVGGVAGGANIPFSVTAGELLTFRYTLATHELSIETTNPPPAGLGQSRAQWIDADTIAVPADLAPAGASWTLYASNSAGIGLSGAGVVGAGETLGVTAAGALSAAQLMRFPALAGYTALRVGVDAATTEPILTGQLLLGASFAGGTVALTGVQLAGVLDDRYATAASSSALGLSWAAGAPTLRLWAPTAQRVSLLRYPAGGSTPSTIVATRDAGGVWTVPGAASWAGEEYLWALDVYAPTTGRIEHNVVTDPYSIALTTDSTRSVIVDLDAAATKPALWQDTPAPVIPSETSRTIYELSVRDFSSADPTVPEAQRGTYGAFALESDGTRHLRDLAAAGMNTVHLQPTFDFSSVPENRADQLTPACDLAAFGPASPEQQACITAIASKDAFNWGYDPLHFLAPEGSFAVQPDGAPRTVEFRTMVGALHKDGLQVVLDQVFNHTSGSGQASNSVLDKVVPGYYQRLDGNGNVYTSTCCQNVATEHRMTLKLMVDTVVLWAKQYRVDGFRFDLMGFNSVEDMTAMRAALDRLTLARDGVDGKKVALYGEGWNFGEVANNALFTQAVQGQLGGTGIGTFNDRLRDGVRGGSPVDGGTYQKQGYGSGLGTASNGLAVNGDEAAGLGHAEDLVKLGLAGNLRNYSFITSDGTVKTGQQLDYNGSPAGYADQPDETVNYVDAHDNQTLYDTLAVKLPADLPMADRVRMQVLSLATATLSQSPSMWLAGSDLLRSKSLDGNSYDSGDWFNAVDWSGADNGFGRGLPMAADNADHWDVDRPLLADPTLKPSAADIATASANSAVLLRLKAATPLFSLGGADAIRSKLTFPVAHNAGTILMVIDDRLGADVDPALDGALVVFNAGADSVTETIPGLVGRTFALASQQAAGPDTVVTATSWDAALGTVTVPGRSVAVLFEAQASTPVPPIQPGVVTPEGTLPDQLGTTRATPASAVAAGRLADTGSGSWDGALLGAVIIAMLLGVVARRIARTRRQVISA